MVVFLEELKARMADAQKRLQVAQAALQAAQATHNAIAQEWGSLQVLYQIETKRIQAELPQPAPSQPANALSSAPAAAGPPQAEDKPELNKTEMVRDLLRQHPNGMQANEVWKALQGQIGYRPYLYSILKRLRDKGDVFQRRGKYYAKMVPKTEEGNKELMVQ